MVKSLNSLEHALVVTMKTSDLKSNREEHTDIADGSVKSKPKKPKAATTSDGSRTSNADKTMIPNTNLDPKGERKSTIVRSANPRFVDTS